MKTRELYVRENVRNLVAYSSARSEYTEQAALFLDANENPFGDMNRYPDPNQTALKNLLSKRFDVQPNQFFIGNGSDEVIDLLLRIFCEPGADKALTFTPTYGMYRVSAAINNVELVEVPLDEHFDITADSLDAALTDPSIRLIFICSPNNPTGNLLSRNRIESLLDRFAGIVCIDEAYIDFAETPSFTEILNRYPNLVVARTLSKAWGLAGARIGIACASEAIIGYFNKVKPPYNVSSLNQTAALAALKQETLFLSRLEMLRAERQRLEIELRKLPFIQTIYPSQTNFLLVQCANHEAIYNALLLQKIVVRNRDKDVKGCLRITVGLPEENTLLLQTLNNFIP